MNHEVEGDQVLPFATREQVSIVTRFISQIENIMKLIITVRILCVETLKIRGPLWS